MATNDFTDNSSAVLSAADAAIARALEIIGGTIETYAKELVAPLGPKGNPMNRAISSQLRNSITHISDGKTVTVGSNLPMAAYVELGTGREYRLSAEWINNTVQQGPHSGLDHWIFYDERKQEFRVGLPMKPTPFLRPAVEEHKQEYENILRSELQNG